MSKKRHRSTEVVMKFKQKIHSMGDLRKLFKFAEAEMNLTKVMQKATDTRLVPQIPLDKILIGQTLAFAGTSQNLLDSENLFCSRRFLNMLNVSGSRLISDSREREIFGALDPMQFQKEVLFPLVKEKLHMLQNEEDCMKGIRHAALDMTTCSDFGVVDAVATGTNFSLPLGSVLPSAYLEDQEKKKEFDKYRTEESLVREYANEKEKSVEEKKHPASSDARCKGKGFEIPGSKLLIDDITVVFGKGTFNLLSMDAKHFCYSEMKFAKDRETDLLIRIRKDDGRGLLLIDALEDTIKLMETLKGQDPRYGKGTGEDTKRNIKWTLRVLSVEKEETDIKELPCDVLVCKLTQESTNGKEVPEEERERYIVTTKVDISYEAIYETSKRHWQVEEQHKKLAQIMNMKHIWSHNPNVAWVLFILMLIAEFVTTLYFVKVVVYIFGMDELRKQKIGLIVLLRLIRQNWNDRKVL